MRWFFSFLVVLNIFVWFWFQSDQKPAEVAVSEVAPPKGGVTLLAELPDAKRNSLEKTASNEPVATVKDPQCGWYGPVPEIVTRKTLVFRFKEAGVKAEAVQLPQTRYVVYVGPEKDYQAASAKAASFRDKKIDAFVIKQGAFANSVQIGAFLKEDNARKRQRQLKEQHQLLASIRPDDKYLEETWVVIPGSDYKRLESTVGKKILEDFQFLEARRMDCPG